MKKTINVNRSSALLVLLLLAFSAMPASFVLSSVAFAKHRASPPSGFDDSFGIFYDGGNVPTNTQGLRISFSSSTTGITFVNSSGAVQNCQFVDLVAGSYGLEPCVSLFDKGNSNCSSHGISVNCWDISLGWFDSLGHGHPNDVGAFSASTYPTFSGTIEGYYSGSAWVEKVYISQLNNYYSSTPSVCSTTCTTVDGSANDWAIVETPKYQPGDHFSSSFAWTLTNPQFLKSGMWYGYNSQAGGTDTLKVRVYDAPGQSNNTLSIAQLTSTTNPGAKIYYYGSSPPNLQGNTWTWTWSVATAFVQSNQGHNTGCPTNCASGFTITLSASVTTGDMLIVAVGTYATGGSFGISDSQGNSYSIAINKCVNDCVEIFYGTAAWTGSYSVTISTNYASTYTYAFVVEVSHTSGSLDKTSYCASSCTGNPSVASFTPTSGTAVLDIAAGESGWGAGSSYTMIGSSTSWSAASEYAMNWSGGSTTAPWTASGGTFGEVAASFVPT